MIVSELILEYYFKYDHSLKKLKKTEEFVLDFEKYIDLLEETLCSLGNVQTKKINYGAQIILTGTGKKVTLNVYNGKKGISLVWGGGDDELQARAAKLVQEIPLHNKKSEGVSGARGNNGSQNKMENREKFISVLPRHGFCLQMNRVSPVYGWAAMRAAKAIILGLW